MLIKEKEMLVTKTELKKNSKGEAYLVIDMIDASSGDSFNVVSKDIELMSKLEKMTKYILNLDLSSTKYGLKMNIDAILKKV